jgi:hypothetical protein
MTDVANRFADLLFGRAKLQCTVCGSDRGACDCWTKCKTVGCTWSYRKGTFCPNCRKAKLSNGERND